MTLPTSARIVTALWAVAALVSLAAAVRQQSVAGWPGAWSIAFAGVFGALMVASWARPVKLSIDGGSDADGLHEGFFVLLALLVPAALTVVVFAVVAVIAQTIKRRLLAQSIFNVAQVVTSASVAAAVFVALHGPGDPTGYAKVGAALAGALSYLVVDTTANASILSSLGTPWRRVVFGSVAGEALVAAGSISIALPTALLLSRNPRLLPLTVAPFLLLGYLGEGHFYARHDRARLRRLFDATIEVNRSVDREEIKSAVLRSAGSLLRSPRAALTARRPEDGLAAPVDQADRTLWLGVSGRSRTEPFDQADRALLNALASAGTIALANADRYAEVQQEREQLAEITRSLAEGVCAVNRDGDITFLNPAGACMLGWYDAVDDDGLISPSEGTPRFLLDPAMRAMALRRSVTSYDTRFDRPDGSHFPVTMTASPMVGDPSPAGAVIVFRDTSERKAFEEQLARHAFQDALTGLANRRLLLDHLDHALLQSDRTGGQVAVLFCDIDRFKIVNDNLGHQLGDELLRVIADRLRHTVRPGDTLSRFGGDEFIILLEGMTSASDASVVADAVLEALRDPVILTGGHEVVATMSIGIALSEAGKSRDDLLHDADVAMYRAKDRGRGGQYAMFDVDRMAGRSADCVDLSTALRHVINRDEIEVYYQPLVSLADGSIVGAEALVRWAHTEHGILLPAQFIKLAEDNGTIVPIGRLVLERACHQVKEWQDRLGVTLQVGVNLSTRQFRQESLAEDVAAVLRTTSIDPGQLSLEITESLVMDDIEFTSTILNKLRALGVRLAIDDFGTGYSSLGHLARFPIDVVKIDQTFVGDIDRDPVKSANVSALVALSQAIGSSTVVEGVESLAQLEHLTNLGCDYAQGFYFARPQPVATFDKLLSASASSRPDLRLVRGGESLAV